MFDDACADCVDLKLRPGQVVINKLLYQDLSPRRVRVVSVAPDFERILVEAGVRMDSVDQGHADDNRDGCDDGREAAGRGAVCLAAADFDFVNFMALLGGDDETSSKQPEPQPKRRKKSTSAC